MKVINHLHPRYRQKWESARKNRFNGAYYYSKEICQNIIPNIDTDRNWITVNIPPYGVDHSIVFIHNNLHPERYEWLSKYDDLILVCGIPETIDKVKHLGKAIYLPLSIDMEYVQQFKIPKKDKKGTAFAGRPSKRTMNGIDLPDDIDILEGLKRPDLLKAMARYDTIYAVGRTAVEAKALGCKLKAYDARFPKVSIWKPLDNFEAAKMLQEMLDEIDKK